MNRRKFLLSAGSALTGYSLTGATPFSSTPRPSSGEKLKVLLDSDIGSDIDDAVCLAYLLANPRCELLGITTVTGEAEKRAMLASALCKAAGKDIPIYPGTEKPLLIEQKQKTVPQAAQLKNWAHEKDFPKGEAIRFLRETIHSRPGEIFLLAVGPLTNLGLLFATDPEIPRLLKGLVLMCGKFTDAPSPWGPTEWNAIVDPHATAIVYRSRPKIHRSVGLDVTLEVKMTPGKVKKKFSRYPLLRPVYDFSKIWFEEREVLHFHDPLAAATLFNDHICAFHRGTVAVELSDQKRLGFTRWTPGEGPHEVALEVAPDLFFKEYFSVFKPSPK